MKVNELRLDDCSLTCETMMADHSIVDGHLFLLSPLMTVLDESSAIFFVFFRWLDESPDISFDALHAASSIAHVMHSFFWGIFLLILSLVL